MPFYIKCPSCSQSVLNTDATCSGCGAELEPATESEKGLAQSGGSLDLSGHPLTAGYAIMGLLAMIGFAVSLWYGYRCFVKIDAIGRAITGCTTDVILMGLGSMALAAGSYACWVIIVRDKTNERLKQESDKEKSDKS